MAVEGVLSQTHCPHESLVWPYITVNNEIGTRATY